MPPLLYKAWLVPDEIVPVLVMVPIVAPLFQIALVRVEDIVPLFVFVMESIVSPY